MDHVHVDVRNENRPRVRIDIRRVGPLQRECFAIALQHARVEGKNRHGRWHVVFQTEHRRIGADQQEQSLNFHAGGKSESCPVELPGVRRMERVIEFHRRRGNVLEFDEFLIAQGGMVLDFVDHHRPDPRHGIRLAQRVRRLCRVLRFTSADRIAPEAHPVLRRPEAESVAVAGQVAVRVGREEVDFLAVRVKAEARG